MSFVGWEEPVLQKVKPLKGTSRELGEMKSNLLLRKSTTRCFHVEAMENKPLYPEEMEDNDKYMSFTEAIKASREASRFSIPKMHKFNGKENHVDHVLYYNTHMNFVGESPTLNCKRFHITLLVGAKK
ncbi:hypothetical protein Fot_20732 [Forsythia ovata]|uniref:Uncharacterized protein n=1 Tax=Forsythia ovata TaxID=205694 RepID=A0ABD1USU0_9LAMI